MNLHIPKSVQVDVTYINGVQYAVRSLRHQVRKEKIQRLFENKKAT